MSITVHDLDAMEMRHMQVSRVVSFTALAISYTLCDALAHLNKWALKRLYPDYSGLIALWTCVVKGSLLVSVVYAFGRLSVK
jgi:hypothetical protein